MLTGTVTRLLALTATLASLTGVALPVPTILYCTSVKIEPATVNSLGQHRLAFNFSNSASENGELAIVDTVNPTDSFRGTGFTLTAPFLGVPVSGDAFFDTPQTDANSNGIDDLFEVDQSQPVATKAGTLNFKTLDDEDVEGTVVARWQRAAGETRGSVEIRIAFPGYTQTFKHPFEIFQFAGETTYVRTGTNVAAQVSLTRQGAAGSLQGAWNLTVDGPDSLTQAGGAWVPGQPEFKFEPTSIDDNGVSYDLTRGGLRTNYFGSLQFNAGSPVDPVPLDFALWEIHLFDPNDADLNRIPNLTDPAFGSTTPPPLTPQIFISQTNGLPSLTLSGTAGRNYVVEQRDVLTGGTWTPSSTNQPAADGRITVLLPAPPADRVRFWRARSL